MAYIYKSGSPTIDGIEYQTAKRIRDLHSASVIARSTGGLKALSQRLKLAVTLIASPRRQRRHYNRSVAG